MISEESCPPNNADDGAMNSEENTVIKSGYWGTCPPVQSTCLGKADQGNNTRDTPPPPSGCDNSSSTSLKVKPARLAPHRIVHLENLKEVVNLHLGPCPVCRKLGLHLEEKNSCSFATTLEIVCDTCDGNREKDRLEISYLTKKIEQTQDTAVLQKKTRDELRKTKLKRNNKIRYMKNEHLPRHKKRVILPVRNKKISVRKRLKMWGKGSITDSEINIRAIMAAFYCGTGAGDIGNVASFLGISGGKSWERSFGNHAPKMCKLITSVVNGVIATSLKNEIRATIKYELEKAKYSTEEIDKAINAFFSNDHENIPELIRKVGLTISYDMGWQKRSTGKVYDSMSGHGFIFGVHTGNIIGYRVKSKSCAICNKANFMKQKPPAHDCTINWEGASGGMEAGVALEMWY